MIGEFPGLKNLDEDGNLRPTSDFRGLYSALLEQWLGASHPAPYERIAHARSRGKENPIPGANGAM